MTRAPAARAAASRRGAASADDDLVDRARREDLAEAAGVVELVVGHEDGPRAGRCRESARALGGGAAGRAARRSGPGPARRLEQDRVSLADVEPDDAQRAVGRTVAARPPIRSSSDREQAQPASAEAATIRTAIGDAEPAPAPQRREQRPPAATEHSR